MSESPLQHDVENPVQAELVAYLDGELDAQACRGVESRLASDEQYRLELALLQRAWDCLDELPEETVDEAFTRSTIEMVATSAKKEIESAEQHAHRHARTRAILITGGLLATTLLGFLLTAALLPWENRRLLRDLGVIENLDYYQQVEDVAFLRMLVEAGILTAEALPEANDPLLPEVVLTSGEDVAAKRKRVASLAADEKARLATRLKRFEMLPAEQQENLRALHEQLRTAEDSAQLQAALSKYFHWLKQLSSGEQADIAAVSGSERLEVVKRIFADWQRRQMRQLSHKDMQAVLRWLEGFVYDHRAQFVASFVAANGRRPAGSYLQRFDELPENQRRLLVMRMLMAFAKSRGVRPNLPKPSDEEMQRLAENLSPVARTKLSAAESQENQHRLLITWIQAALRARLSARMLGPDGFPVEANELEQFFAEELSNAQREELLGLPQEAWERRLRELYMEKHLQGEAEGSGLPRDNGPNWPPSRPEPHEARPGSGNPLGDRDPRKFRRPPFPRRPVERPGQYQSLPGE